jgi:hypothetical protein
MSFSDLAQFELITLKSPTNRVLAVTLIGLIFPQILPGWNCKEVELAAGAQVPCTFREPVSTRTAHVGEPYWCDVAGSPSVLPTLDPVIPRPSFLNMTVTQVDRPGKFYKNGRISFRVTELRTPDGRAYTLQGYAKGFQSTDLIEGPYGEVKARRRPWFLSWLPLGGRHVKIGVEDRVKPKLDESLILQVCEASNDRIRLGGTK